MTAIADFKPRDRLITPTGEVYIVKDVYTYRGEDEHYMRLEGTSVECQRGRVDTPYMRSLKIHDFIENDLDWLGSCVHEVFTVTQPHAQTKYWVSAECFMDGDRVRSAVYRMGDAICDGGTSNLGTELSEIAAQLDRDAFQIADGKHEARYNRVVIEVSIEHGQHQRSEYRDLANEATS